MKSKHAQVGPVGALILFGFFLVIFFAWLGGWVNLVGSDTVRTNNLHGIEALVFSNLSFVIVIAMILGIMGWMYFSK